jgi:F-type H+-transporting ATPase subunit b
MAVSADVRRSRCACETWRKLPQALLIAGLLTGAPAVGAVRLHAAQVEPAAANAGEEPEQAQGRGIVDILARLVNFGILAGTLVYLLRAPIGDYLASRGTQIRRDLVEAAEMKTAAAAQLEEIDRKLKSLPGELAALRAQSVEEIAAEETRIRTAAAAERDRLLEQARREIGLQVKVAERDLVAHAADLAVGVATDRIKTHITSDDQQRLVDRYVQQVRG